LKRRTKRRTKNTLMTFFDDDAGLRSFVSSFSP